MQLKIEHVPPLPTLQDEQGRIIPPPFTTQFWNVDQNLVINLDKFKLQVIAISNGEIQVLCYDNRGVSSKDGAITPAKKEAFFTLKRGKAYRIYSNAQPIIEYWRILLRS